MYVSIYKLKYYLLVCQMSSSKPQNKRVLPYSNNQNLPRSTLTRSPLAQTELLQIRHKYMLDNPPILSFPHPPFLDYPPPTILDYPVPVDLPEVPKFTYNQLIDQVGRLEEVICYLKGDKEELKDSCVDLQEQLVKLREASQKEKEGLQSQIRKMKEQLRQKGFECQGIAKISKKQKEMLQQQNQRMKAHIKTLIQKKNDQVFALAQQHQVQYQKIKQNLQIKIEENKQVQENALKILNDKLDDSRQEVVAWKQKYRDLQEDIQRQDRRAEENKLTLIQQHQTNMAQLKQKYHRTKILLIQRSKEEVKVLEDAAEVQKSVFIEQIKRLKETVQSLQKQIKWLKEIAELRAQGWHKQFQEDNFLIHQLQAKLQAAHRTRQQQMELTQVKVSQLHATDLESIEKIYSNKLSILQQIIIDRQAEIKRLHEQLEKQLAKTGSLLTQMKQRDSQLNQQMAKMRVMHGNAEQSLRIRFETQKSLIIQQSTQSIKLIQAKAGNVAFKEQELKRMRLSLQERVNQIQQLQSANEKERQDYENDRAAFKKELAKAQSTWREQQSILKKQLTDKQIKNQQLRQQIKKTLILSQPDYEKYLGEIAQLKNKIADLVNIQKDWQDKCSQLQDKVRQLNQEQEKITFQANLIVNQAKAEWQAIQKQRIDQMEDFYQRKVAHLEQERDHLNAQYIEARNKADSVALKYLQLQSLLEEVTNALHKKGELQLRVIELGMDTNLVKNKQELFQF